jgi:hypothetical protein
MAYYQANTDSDAILCGACGEVRWESHPKYGSNVDARLAEAQETGIRWAWVSRYSSDKMPCSDCGELTY